MDRKWGRRRVANAIGVMALAGAVVWAGAAGVAPMLATAAIAAPTTTTATVLSHEVRRSDRVVFGFMCLSGALTCSGKHAA